MRSSDDKASGGDEKRRDGRMLSVTDSLRGKTAAARASFWLVEQQQIFVYCTIVWQTCGCPRPSVDSIIKYLNIGQIPRPFSRMKSFLS